MHLKRSVVVTTVLLFLFASFYVFNTTAQTDIESRVTADINIEFITATHFTITAEMNVQRITVFDTTYTSGQIQVLETTDPETLGAIKLRLRQMLKDQLEQTFGNAIVNATIQKPAYQKPIFTDNYAINLTTDFFEIPDTINVHNFINGVLDMDAIVTYPFNFQAEPGWNNTYNVILPETMSFRNTTGTYIGNKIQWTIKNSDGDNPSEKGYLYLNYTNPTSVKTDNEKITLSFELDTRNIVNTQLKNTIHAQNIDITRYNILPSSITNLDIVPSDGIRLFIENGLLTWDNIYQQTIKPIEQNIKTKIENSTLNQTLDITFSWNQETTTNCTNPYNITQMDNQPEIKAELTDENINLKILSHTTKAVFGLVNAGATANITKDDVNFGDKIDEIGYPYNGYLHLPANITLEGENKYNWNQNTSITGEIISDTSPTYTNEEIEIQLDLDITKMDLNIPSFFTGKTELTASTYTNEDINIYVTKIPNEFNLPNKISLEFLNSDAFRLCIEEQVFKENEITNFLTNKKQNFETTLSNILNIPDQSGHTDRNEFTNSLNWDQDISNMDKISPVTVSTYAHSIYSIPFNLTFIPPSFTIPPQKYYLKGKTNSDITYRIIFPKGITVEANDTLQKTISQGETEDGNDYIEIIFNANETTQTDIITCKLSTTPLYLLSLFLPCILSLIVIIILIIVIYIIRKKRRIKRGYISEEPTEPEGYNDQDYYVPPPPPNSR